MRVPSSRHALLALVAGVVACRQGYPPGGPHHFRSFEERTVPIRPAGALTAAEADRLRASQPVIEAYFDGAGRILRCRKLYRDRVLFSEEYSYRPTGLIRERQLTKENGTRIVWSFDEDGMPFAREEQGSRRDAGTGG